jgi:hypothetical protein
MPRRRRNLRRALSLAVAATLIAAVSAADAAARSVPQGFYGVMYDRAVAESSPAEQDAQWALMARSGVESVRTVFLWSTAQPEAGMGFDFTVTDLTVTLAARHNIKLLPVVRSTPMWAARGRFEHGSPPKRISDYTAYLHALVGRYGPDGSFWKEHPEVPRRPQREWQIWNEPHFDYYWSTRGRPKDSWAPEYARLLKKSKATIESVDPGATIVLAGLADFAWLHLARLNRFKIRRYFDVASLNLFTTRPRLAVRGLRVFRRALRRGGEGGKPLWLTEITWPAAKDRVPVPQVGWQRAWYTTDAGMAKRLHALYSIAAATRRKLGLGRVYWYTWASAYDDGDLFDYSGLNRFSDGVSQPRPALAAFAASARKHEGCRKTDAGVCAR